MRSKCVKSHYERKHDYGDFDNFLQHILKFMHIKIVSSLRGKVDLYGRLKT